MNRQESDVLKELVINSYTNQRILSEHCGHSLGTVNKTIKQLQEKGLIDENVSVTLEGKEIMNKHRPKNGIILAAGVGMRMVPINTQMPKGLIEVREEPLVERIIKQLRQVNVEDIYIVVGFMKEQYEYLIDKYNVNLVVNAQYSKKNNLHTLKLVADKLENSYIIPCDIWCKDNPFSQYEPYSWYMVTDKYKVNSTVRVNRKLELAVVSGDTGGNTMIGIAYIDSNEAGIMKERIDILCKDMRYDGAFWEEILYGDTTLLLQAKQVNHEDVIEINTYEQLTEFNKNYNQLNQSALELIMQVLGVTSKEIKDISLYKKGIMNRTFLFVCKGKKYLIRIPNEETKQVMNRRKEAEVYNIIEDKQLCDNVIFFNPDNGYKISEYLENVRRCNPNDTDDLDICMKKLRRVHELELSVSHEFDIFREIDFYESLWEGKKSSYRDYQTTKDNILKLKSYVEKHCEKKVLSHIDPNCDNFLVFTDINGDKHVRLIDWEYAGMQDPHVDIAMFCIYIMYDRTQVDDLIDRYFPEGCRREIRIKIYCYIAICGLLWSNWCEYKSQIGIEFGEYSLKQYRYAKEYFKIVKEELQKIGEDIDGQ